MKDMNESKPEMVETNDGMIVDAKPATTIQKTVSGGG